MFKMMGFIGIRGYMRKNKIIIIIIIMGISKNKIPIGVAIMFLKCMCVV
jgi:hypothetical protein